MRIRKKGRTARLAAAVAIALGIFCLSAITQQRFSTTGELSTGSARLVSIRQVPNDGEFCASPEPVSAIATLSAEFEQDRLFDAFKEKSVYAAETVEVNRQPARMIRDTYPIYSSVAVDPVRDEVVLASIMDTDVHEFFNKTAP